MTIRTFEAFAGYGSQMMALKRLENDYPEVHFEAVGISEIDPNPIKAYKAVHGDIPNYGDISKIDWNEVPDFDLFTYSFPCQDVSSSGYQKGFAEGSGTRSGLLWECTKAIIAKKPKYLLMENVKALCSKKFMPDFQKWLDFLSEQGYSNKWQVLNAKKYGIPQNRERVFCVSVLGDDTYQFPEPFELKKHIKDILETPIAQDTFYNEDYLHNLHWFDNSGKTYKNDSIIKLGNMFQSNHQSGTIYDINGCCGTIMLHHGTGTLVAIPDNNGGYKVKKLSTREMFRCMGVDDDDIDKMIGAVGKTAAWKLAGNSIVVDVLYHIFKTMFVK